MILFTYPKFKIQTKEHRNMNIFDQVLSQAFNSKTIFLLAIYSNLLATFLIESQIIILYYL